MTEALRAAYVDALLQRMRTAPEAERQAEYWMAIGQIHLCKRLARALSLRLELDEDDEEYGAPDEADAWYREPDGTVVRA